MQWNTVTIMIASIAGAALATVLAFLAVKYRTWITAKVKNERVAGVLARLGDFAFRVVGELNQTVVEQLKKDGKWNAEAAAQVKADALAKLKSYLGAKGIAEAMEVLGLDNAGLEALLATYIESWVGQLKMVESVEKAA
jgi:putative flippase GtrA